MVKIRLRRMGVKKKPYYRIVVADSRSPRDGRFIEEIGSYNPLKQPSEIKVNMERANYWISQGAQPTDTVRALLKKLATPGSESVADVDKSTPDEQAASEGISEDSGDTATSGDTVVTEV